MFFPYINSAGLYIAGHRCNAKWHGAFECLLLSLSLYFAWTMFSYFLRMSKETLKEREGTADVAEGDVMEVTQERENELLKDHEEGEANDNPPEVIIIDNVDNVVDPIVDRVKRVSLTPDRVFPSPGARGPNYARNKKRRDRQATKAGKEPLETVGGPGPSAGSSSTLKTPNDPNKRGTKRSRSVTTPGSGETRSPPTKRPPTYSEAAVRALQVIITYSDGGRGDLTATHFRDFKLALEGSIFACKGEPQVKIETCDLIRGRGVIQCSDEITNLWIHSQVENLLLGNYKAWNYGELPEPAPAPKLKKVRCWVAGERPPVPRDFFEALASQNGLNMTRWRSITTVPHRDGGHTLIFQVDEASISAMKEYDLRPFYGLGRLALHELASRRRQGSNKGTTGGEGGQPEHVDG
jgi:hypothetical protein